jgi:hypothetical protein
MTTVLIVGSFPPIPLPAAAQSLLALRQAWAEGLDATVVSPRVSAADYSVPVCGPLAGIRLERMRRLTSSTRLVLVVERGFPFTPGGHSGPDLVTALGLARALRRFEHVKVVRVGQAGIGQRALSVILAGADDVVDVDGGPAPEGVTPLGPPEATPAERPAVIAEKVARRVLGRHAGRVAALARTARRRLTVGG